MHRKSHTGGIYMHSHIKTARIARGWRQGRRRWVREDGLEKMG
jgi:hypothetical protein